MIVVFSGFSLDALVGNWDVSGAYDGSVTCKKISDNEANCILSKYGLRVVTFKDGILNWGTLSNVTKPTLKIDRHGKKMIDWNNETFWTEAGELSTALLNYLKYLFLRYFQIISSKIV